MEDTLKLFANDDPFLFQLVQSELESLGIPHFVKNQFASGAMGELAPQDTIQEVWLTDPTWLARAKKVVEDLVRENEPEQALADWRCSHCGELNDGAFALCWQCQTPHNHD